MNLVHEFTPSSTKKREEKGDKDIGTNLKEQASNPFRYQGYLGPTHQGSLEHIC